MVLAVPDTALAQVSPTVESGVINGARFRVEIPPKWNRGLVMYTIGYAVVGQPPTDRESPAPRAFRETFLSKGFAFAESSYRTQGWAVKEGLEDVEALRQHFVTRYGAPTETYIVGQSMGAHISVLTAERHPDAYQGVLAMCGPLGAAGNWMEHGLFDMLVTFETLFPGSIGSRSSPSAGTGAKVKTAMAANAELAKTYAARFGRPLDQLPFVLSLGQIIAGELKIRAGGEPFDNRNRFYTGFGDDPELNRRVTRYTAERKAREYLRQYSSPTGRASDPVLALHATGDPLVLGADITAYEWLAEQAGNADRFVMRFVDAVGHCNFTPAQTGATFDALLLWARRANVRCQASNADRLQRHSAG